MEPIDVVWLKKDIRLHDHGPLSLLTKSSRQCIILYLYEPDQLSEKTVHGSHIEFINEGLVDLDRQLSGGEITNFKSIYEHNFQCITVCYAGAVFTLHTIHKQRPIYQILSHLETGHLKSFARDKAVRRWCRSNNVIIHELNQTGVTRCLADRDDFTTNFNRFLDHPIWQTPTREQLEKLRKDVLITINQEMIKLHGVCPKPLKPLEMQQIPDEHKADRTERQCGGETQALSMLNSFLSQRGYNYSSGISSPNTSWTTCSRLSPYLTWGNISLRFVINMTKRRQGELREAKNQNKKGSPNPWLRSLASFQSRMHWRSHFIQKLESQPSLEIQDQCLAFSHLRRQPGDFNQQHFDAWCQGRTGFPFVDACMRCLIRRGWINFRMRAMLVSFATYNLWLDWKIVAPHLARLFLDYEPGIHYPQLQMQAGTTGINTMRVYNVTKQGEDQDPDGAFIRKYVFELKHVPNEYIHEPHKMSISQQTKCGLLIEGRKTSKSQDGLASFVRSSRNDSVEATSVECCSYPYPIIDEKYSAKVAKDKLSVVRKQQSTKEEAQQVYIKHGSRRFRGEDRNGVTTKASKSVSKRAKVDDIQTSLLSRWSKPQPETSLMNHADTEEFKDREDSVINLTDCNQNIEIPPTQNMSACTNDNKKAAPQKSPTVSPKKQPTISTLFANNKEQHDRNSEWNCKICTYINEKPLALACGVCGSLRN